MKIAEADFNIRIVSSDGIPDSLLTPGQVTILGKREELWRYAHKVHTDIQVGIDRKSTYYRHNLRIVDDFDELAGYLDCNIIAPLPNLLTGETEMVIASTRPEDLGIAAAEVMKEIENRTRKVIESTIALFALGARAEYGFAVDTLLGRSSRYERLGAPKPSSQPRRFLSFISFKGRKRYNFEEGIVAGQSSPVEDRSGQRVSDRKIREVYENLPDRYSDLYERRNPEAAQILRRSLDVIDQQSLVALLFEAAKTDKGLLQRLQKAKLKIASRYGIKVRPWSKEQKGHFKDQYRFCIYLTDEDGNEVPIKFRNNPSYCIFMMYVLDRHTRGIEATSLEFQDNQEEFKRLYSTIFNEDNEKIEAFCKEMIHREAKEKGFIRKGRYDDYLKDINDTMDELVGCPDSMSLKVGHGQFLEIPSNQIEIDKGLTKFTFV